MTRCGRLRKQRPPRRSSVSSSSEVPDTRIDQNAPPIRIRCTPNSLLPFSGKPLTSHPSVGQAGGSRQLTAIRWWPRLTDRLVVIRMLNAVSYRSSINPEPSFHRGNAEVRAAAWSFLKNNTVLSRNQMVAAFLPGMATLRWQSVCCNPGLVL